jgi:hypothetical protein
MVSCLGKRGSGLGLAYERKNPFTLDSYNYTQFFGTVKHEKVTTDAFPVIYIERLK